MFLVRIMPNLKVKNEPELKTFYLMKKWKLPRKRKMLKDQICKKEDHIEAFEAENSYKYQPISYS